jgi:hypothetical protein
LVGGEHIEQRPCLLAPQLCIQCGSGWDLLDRHADLEFLVRWRCSALARRLAAASHRSISSTAY